MTRTTIEKTTTYEARRVETLLRVRQDKPAGWVSLIDMSAALPVLLAIGARETGAFLMSPALKSGDTASAFLRCPADQ